MQGSFWLWQDDIKRKINGLTLVLFILSTALQTAFAYGTPQVFARPGAGVSRLPLEVTMFDAPGFGELETAINLANGNLFVSADQVSKNNLTTSGTDETTNLFGSGWNFTPRLRLTGFSRWITTSTMGSAPTTYTLYLGDGSSQTFTKVTTGFTVPPLSTAPHWIKRYQGLSNVLIYRNDKKIGTQYSDEYIALVVYDWGNTVAHYYTHDGTRYSFTYDGEYVDRMQTLAEQYRGATSPNNDPEGEAEGLGDDVTWLTDFWYTTWGGGKLAYAKDAWNRKTWYEWNSDNNLKAVYFGANNALSWPPDSGQYNTARSRASRMIELYYGDRGSPAIKVVTGIKFTTYDGVSTTWSMPTYGNNNGSGVISRTYEFDYTLQNGKVLLSKLRKPVLDGQGWLETVYGYDATSNKLIQVDQKAYGASNNYLGLTEPTTTYTYQSLGGSASTVAVDDPQATGNTAGMCTPTWYENGGTVQVLRCNDSRATYSLPANLTPGYYTVQVTARGIESQGWPVLELRQGGQALSQIQVSSSGYTNLSIGQAYLTPNSTLDLAYINDYCCTPADRDVLVDYLTLVPATTTGASTSVTVTQGTGLERKQTEYQFDGSNQLVRKRVRDYNPNIANTQWLQIGGMAPERWLEWNYAYYNNGSTKHVISPTGAKTEYLYDNMSGSDTTLNTQGNLTAKRIYTSANAGTPERETTYTYADPENPNLVTSEKLFSQNANSSRDGISFNYSTVDTRKSYTHIQSPLISGQRFKMVSKVTSDLYVGSEGTPTRTVVDEYNPNGVANGLLWKTTRSGKTIGTYGVASQTTTYTYADGLTWRPYVPTTSGGINESSRVTDADPNKAAVQYGDLVANINNGEYSKELSYNHFGQPVLTIDRLAYAKDFSGSTPTLQDRGTALAYDGFGNKVWELVYNDVEHSKKRWYYYASGELNYSWEGSDTNVTDYAYGSGVDTGRATSITQGIGSGGSVSTPHESTALVYDSFGRVMTKTIDGYSYGYWFDTLDREVRETLPNSNGFVGKTYDLSGELGITDDEPTNPLNDSILVTVRGYDTLGRKTQESYDAHSSGAPAGSSLSNSQRSSSVVYTYDPFDRVIKVVDNRLAMNTSGTNGDNRASYFVYDSLGNLLRKMEPPLRTEAGGGYTDTQRPYAEYTYDAFDRVRKQQALLRGTLTLGDLNGVVGNASATLLGSGAVTATVSTQYDAFDRPTLVTDPELYTTEMAYDPSGNVVEQKQLVCKSSDTTNYSTCTAQSAGLTSDKVITRTAYDALGRAVKSWSPRAVNEPTTVQPTRKVYNVMGSLKEEWDERGLLVKQYDYTADGLLAYVYEPDNQTGTPANVSGPSGYVVTKSYTYGSRKYPSQSCEHGINDSTTACTTQSYDFAGRPDVSTLPDGSTIDQDYDGRGNKIRVKDPEGFVTEYTYDSWGNLIQENKKARSTDPSHQDYKAGLVGGLQTFYEYDLSKNLTKQTKGTGAEALISEFWYNSLNKTTKEHRAHTSAAGTPNTYGKLKTYRLDGTLTAETSYDYEGNLTSFNLASIDAETKPSVTEGNITGYTYNLRGDKTRERSDGRYQGWEYTSALVNNGLGLKIKREFWGNTSIYQTRLQNDGNSTSSADYKTFWKYSANGKLLDYYEELANGNRQNQFTYTYTPADKEDVQTRDIQLKVRNHLPITDLANGIFMGATVGSVDTDYNERDQISKTVVVDQSASGINSLGSSITRTTDYTYYPDGRKKRAIVGGAYTETTYDSRGREAQIYDSNASPNGAITTKISYGSDGKISKWLEDNSNNNACTYRQEVVPTLGGLSYSQKEWRSGLPFDTASSPCNSLGIAQSSTTAYASTGLSKGSVNVEVYNEGGQWKRRTSTFTFKNENASDIGYGNRLEEWQAFTVETFGNPNNNLSYAGKLIAQNNYNSQGALSQAIRTPHAVLGSNSTVTYTLDSRGNRLSMTDTRGDTAGSESFNGFGKRYNAEGQAVTFQRLAYWAFMPSGAMEGSGTDYYTDFRYDPFGNQVLSSNGRLSESAEQYCVCDKSVSTQAILHNYQIVRQSFSTMNSSGDVQLIRVNSSAGDRFRDPTFSLADGIAMEEWALLQPFGAFKAPTQGLQAPTTPFSTQFHINVGNLGVMEIKPPSAQSTPSTGTTPNPGEIKPPTANAPEQPTSSSPGFSTGNATNPQGLSTLQPLAGANNQNTANVGNAFGLQAPSGVLPSALGSLSLSDVAAPVPTNTVTPPTASDPGKVAPPTPSPSPDPRDTPGTITPPGSSGLTPPTVPPIGTGAPNPITTVTSPVGWNPPQGEGDTVQTLSGGYIGEPRTNPGDISDAKAAIEEQNKKHIEQAKKLEELTKATVAGKFGKDAEKVWEQEIQPLLNSLPPLLRLQSALILADGVTNGSINEAKFNALGDLAQGLKNTTLLQGKLSGIESTADGVAFIVGAAVMSYGDDIASAVVSVIPGIGDIVGLIEAVRGSTLIGNNKLRWLDRGLGALAFVPGISEAKFAKIIADRGIEFALKATRLFNTLRLDASTIKNIFRRGEAVAAACGWKPGKNSFSGDTKVVTSAGLVAIASIAVGTQVLAYNEQNQKNEYRPVTAVHKNQDPEITYLTLRDDDAAAFSDLPSLAQTTFIGGSLVQASAKNYAPIELITTTPGHPFYLMKNGDNSVRPAPSGHEDLKAPWVGAGDLKPGDRVRQSDGSTGVVTMVKTVQETRTMYNLDVAVADTFYVGEGQWLVHNCETVAFGLQKRGLQNFANEQGAKTFADLGLNPTSATFMDDLVKSMTDAKQIKFNITGMDNIGELIRNKEFGVVGGSTNWELQVVSFTPDFRAKTTFHYGDKTYTYEQLLEAFPWKK